MTPQLPDEPRARLPFAKGQALGNDYLVVDAADLPWPLTPPRIRRICDRHTGAGSDGILVRHPGANPFVLRIFNPDGTEAEKSGNGLRIFAAYLHGRGEVAGEPFQVALATDTVTMQVLAELPGGELDIVVDIGRAVHTGRSVGFAPEGGEVLRASLDLGDGLHAAITLVSLGNPHCVVFVDRLDRADFLARAPRLATHAAFVAGTNVQFARVIDDATLEAWIWERGAGETLASGSSATAVAAAARRLGLVASDALTVRMQGGEVRIEVSDAGLRLRGPAGIVYRAELASGFVDLLGSL